MFGAWCQSEAVGICVMVPGDYTSAFLLVPIKDIFILLSGVPCASSVRKVVVGLLRPMLGVQYSHWEAGDM